MSRYLNRIHYFIHNECTNHVVTHIPFRRIRKFWLSLLGSKLKKDSYIDYNCKYFEPAMLAIVHVSHINSECLIDSRGGRYWKLCIGVI